MAEPNKEPIVVEVNGYPYKVLTCQCSEPVVDHWNYHLIGNLIPRLLPGTSFVCKCGGYITKKIDLPKETLDKVKDFWDHPEDW